MNKLCTVAEEASTTYMPPVVGEGTVVQVDYGPYIDTLNSIRKDTEQIPDLGIPSIDGTTAGLRSEADDFVPRAISVLHGKLYLDHNPQEAASEAVHQPETDRSVSCVPPFDGRHHGSVL